MLGAFAVGPSGRIAFRNWSRGIVIFEPREAKGAKYYHELEDPAGQTVKPSEDSLDWMPSGEGPTFLCTGKYQVPGVVYPDGVWVLHMDNGSISLVTPEDLVVSDYAWADNRPDLIAVVVGRVLQSTESQKRELGERALWTIYLVDLNGGVRTKLMEFEAWDVWGIDISPEGDKLVYSVERQLYLLDLETDPKEDSGE